MNIFKKLRGTLEYIFQFGLGRAQIKSKSTGELEVRNATDTDFGVLRVKTPLNDNDAVTKLYSDSAKSIIVTGQHDGTIAIPANTGVRRFLVVTTTGMFATIGDVVYDNGTGVGGMSLMLAVEGRIIIVPDIISGGAISFNADSMNIWDSDGITWIQIGSVVFDAGNIKQLRMTLDTTATQDSTVVIDTNSQVTQLMLNIVTPFSGGTTIKVGKVGTLDLLLDTTETDVTVLENYLFYRDIVWGLASDVQVTIAGAPAAGSAILIINYALANV